MSRSFKKKGVLKATWTKGKAMSARAFRRRNRQRLQAGDEDILDRKAIFNQYDVNDYISYYNEPRLRRVNDTRRKWFGAQEISMAEWKRIYFRK